MVLSIKWETSTHRFTIAQMWPLQQKCKRHNHTHTDMHINTHFASLCFSRKSVFVRIQIFAWNNIYMNTSFFENTNISMKLSFGERLLLVENKYFPENAYLLERIHCRKCIWYKTSSICLQNSLSKNQIFLCCVKDYPIDHY